MEQSTALVPVDESAAALAAFGFDEEAVLKPCRLELIQPTKAAEDDSLKAGYFMDTQSNTMSASMNVVPIMMTPGRVLFPPGSDLTAKPVCRSNNGVFPMVSDDLVCQDGGLGCAKCEYSQWKRLGGKQIRPPCNETLTFLLAEFETQFIYRYNVKGTSLSPVKDLKDTIRKMVRTAKVKGMPIPPFGLTFEMSSVKIKGAKGNYYIPKFRPTGQVNPADLSVFANIFAHFTTKRNEEGGGESVDPVAKVLDGEYQSEPAAGYEAA